MTRERAPMPKAYGIWEVTTEGDVEGRSTNHLGTYEGYLDEIALKLADKAYYGLRFRPGKDLKALPAPKRTEVQVSLDIDTGSWDMRGPERVEYFEKLLKGRPVTVDEGQYYACVKLVVGKTKEQLYQEKEEARRKYEREEDERRQRQRDAERRKREAAERLRRNVSYEDRKLLGLE